MSLDLSVDLDAFKGAFVSETVPSDPEAEMILAAREFGAAFFRYEALASRRGEVEDELASAYADRDPITWADAKIRLDDLLNAISTAIEEKGRAEAAYRKARVATGRPLR